MQRQLVYHLAWLAGLSTKWGISLKGGDARSKRTRSTNSKQPAPEKLPEVTPVKHGESGWCLESRGEGERGTGHASDGRQLKR